MRDPVKTTQDDNNVITMFKSYCCINTVTCVN